MRSKALRKNPIPARITLRSMRVHWGSSAIASTRSAEEGMQDALREFQTERSLTTAEKFPSFTQPGLNLALLEAVVAGRG